MLWEALQTAQLRRNRQKLNDITNQHRDIKSQQRDVEARIDRLESLSLITNAVWELLKEQGGLTEQDLLNKVSEIDLRDGKLDGKIQKKQSVTCTSCQRQFSHFHPKCIYCGDVNPVNNAFDKV